MAQKQAKDYYLVVMRGDVEAELQGPFTTASKRDTAAQMHRVEDSGNEDGLHSLDVTKGATVTIGDYSGCFLGDLTHSPAFWAKLTERQRFSYLVNRVGLDEMDALKYSNVKTVRDLPNDLQRCFTFGVVSSH